jgi:hypothetical protein
MSTNTELRQLNDEELVARCRTLAREKQLGVVRKAKTETRKGEKE